MKNKSLEEKLNESLFTKVKKSLVGKIATYSLAFGLALGGVYGCGDNNSDNDNLDCYDKEIPYEMEECEFVQPSLVETEFNGEWTGPGYTGIYTRHCIVRNFEDVPIKVWIAMDVGCNDTHLTYFYPIPNPKTINSFYQYSFDNSDNVLGSCSFSCSFDFEDIEKCETVTKYKTLRVCE